MNRRVSFVFISVVLASVAGNAQEPSPRQQVLTSPYIDPVGGLSLDDSIARALEREPSLRAVRTQVNVAEGARTQAELRPNPSVSFTQQQEPGGTDNQTRIELQWPLDLFRKSGRLAVADREVDAAHQATANQERMLSASVRVEYGAALTAVRTLSVTEQLLSATSRLRALVTSRVEQGATPPLDRDMLRVEEQKLEADRRLQAGVVDRRLVELKRLLGMPADAALTLRQSLEVLVQRKRRDADPSRRAGDHLACGCPRSRRADPRCGGADRSRPARRTRGRQPLRHVHAHRRGLSSAGILVVWHARTRARCVPLRSAGAMVTLPITNRNQGNVAVAEAERTGAAAQLDATRLTAQAEIAAAQSRDEYAIEAFQAYSGDVHHSRETEPRGRSTDVRARPRHLTGCAE